MSGNQDRIREVFSHFPVYLASSEEPGSRTAQAEHASYLMLPVGGRPGVVATDLTLLLFTSREICQRFLNANPNLGPCLPAEFKSAKSLASWMRRHPFRGPTFGWVSVDPPVDLSSSEMYPTTAVLLILETLLEP